MNFVYNFSPLFYASANISKNETAGYAPTVIMAVTNADESASVESVGAGSLAPGDAVLQLQPLPGTQ